VEVQGSFLIKMSSVIEGKRETSKEGSKRMGTSWLTSLGGVKKVTPGERVLGKTSRKKHEHDKDGDCLLEKQSGKKTVKKKKKGKNKPGRMSTAIQKKKSKSDGRGKGVVRSGTV